MGGVKMILFLIIAILLASTVSASTFNHPPVIEKVDFIVLSQSMMQNILSYKLNQSLQTAEQNIAENQSSNKKNTSIVPKQSSSTPEVQSNKPRTQISSAKAHRRKVAQTVIDRLQTEDRVRVIVNLEDKSQQNHVLSQLNSFEKAVDLKNGFAGYVDAADLAALENSPVVDFIYEDRKLTIANAESFPQINADKAANVSFNGFADLTGAGQTVCVIDTGVGYNHDDLGNCTGTEFLNGNCQKTISGWDFCASGGTCSSEDNDPADENGHGTAMSGLIAGNGSGYKGLAPEAKIVALKIANNDGDSWDSIAQKAIDWCIDNATKYNITSISFGLSYVGLTTSNPADCASPDPIGAAIEDAVNNHNLTVIVPTGNDEAVNGIGYPACVSEAIAVSAVADGSGGGSAADVIPNNPTDGWGPNRYPGMTDLMAPGQRIYTLDLESYGSYASGAGGTSYASAHAVGAAILLREYYEERYNKILTPAEIRSILSVTGKPIYDVNTSAYYPRIDILAAVHYEEWAPTVTLESPADAATEDEGVITFNYNVVDNEHEIKNCSLYIDGSLDQTDTSVTESVTQSFTKSLTAASYTWEVKCYDNSTIPNEGTSETRTLTVQAPLSSGNHPGFDLIELEKVLVDGRLVLNSTDPVASAWFQGYGEHNLTGKGQTVAIIDSGLYSNHPEFSGKVLDEWDFYENDDDAQDSWNHGTKMAGIIAAKGVFMEGVAPDANIVSLKITNSTGGGWRSNLIDALDWVLTNGSQYNITTVYIGLGYSLFDGSELDCTLITGAPGKIDSLVSKNITVVAPSGHDSNTTMIAYPACVANTISVGAVPDGTFYPADTWNLTAGGVQSNRRDGLLDLLAPGGDGFTKTTQDDISDDYIGGTGVGTSVPAAYVAGASMLLRGYWDARNWDYSPNGLVNGNIPNTIEMIFHKTGKLIEDDLNPGVYYPRLDLYAAINYEEYPPTVNLESPADAANEPEGSITFEYNAADTQHNIKNCSLYIDGSLDQTDTTVTESVTQSFTKSLTAASYTWEVKCYDNSTIPNEGISDIRTINVQAACAENWTVQYGSCLANDTKLKYYIDENSCGTTNNLPADNGTYVKCYTNDRIAFQSDRDGNDEIYIIKINGSDVQRLTNNAFYDGFPAWSPDGIKIAFVSNRDGNDEIYIMNNDGAGQTRLTSNSDYDSDPSWAPDKTKIAFESDRNGPNEIYIMNIDGTNQTRLTNNPAWDDNPAWSPNGNKIAFNSNRDGNYEIYTINSDGTGITRITNNPAFDVEPSWSPDGNKIAFISDRDGNKEIYIMNSNGSGQQRLTNNLADDSDPSWSSDGVKITFWSDRSGNNEIYTINTDGTELAKLTDNPSFDSHPSWSPEVCAENWIVQYGSCQTNDQQLKYYVDNNSCGTTIDLPVDNGTYISCNYCSEDIQGPFTTSCNANDQQIQYYVDNNYAACCAVTGLPSDCDIDNGTYDNQTLSCDYCFPDWQPYNTTCNGTHLTQYYSDDNNCYAQTGLADDLLGRPSNQTFPCGTGSCNSSSDCGTDRWLGAYCIGNEVWDIYKTYTCSSPGLPNSTCSFSDNNQSKEICAYACSAGICLFPDLTVKNLQLFRPLAPIAAGFTTFKFTIENIGNATAPNVNWLFNMTTLTKTSQETVDIAPGQEVPVFSGGIFNATGAFNITATVDYDNSVLESDEANNQQTIIQAVN
jgi:Tol biopolymer transport system component/subtilisin family serine protease